MVKEENNSGCATIVIGFIIGTIIFNAIYTDKVWDKVFNAPVSSMAATNSICFWFILCIFCSWVLAKIWSSINNEN